MKIDSPRSKAKTECRLRPEESYYSTSDGLPGKSTIKPCVADVADERTRFVAFAILHEDVFGGA